MPISTTYAAQIVIALSLILPRFGVSLGNDELNAMVEGLAIFGSIIWTLYQRYKAGGITMAGVRL